jgi:SEC-C motif-containing protein
MKEMEPCPCCSGKAYQACCESYHTDRELPPTPLALMRSRYSAYAKQLPDYIMHTTHPANSSYSSDKTAWRKSILQFCRSTTFERLEIVDASEEGDEGFVTFIAYLEQRGVDASFREKSRFLKKEGKWLYESRL